MICGDREGLPSPEAEDRLTFDPVTSVKGDFAVNLGLVWLDGDEESPRHSTIQLPPGPWVLKGREGILVGTRSEGRPGSGNMEGERRKSHFANHGQYGLQTLSREWPLLVHVQSDSKDTGGSRGSVYG